MKLAELQDNLEELESNLLIIYETVNLLSISASADILDTQNMDWILFGMTKSLKEAVEEVENLINAVIGIDSKLKEI